MTAEIAIMNKEAIALVLRNESYKFYYSPYNKDCV